MKTRPVIEIFPLTQFSCDASEARSAEKLLKLYQLLLTASHTHLQHFRDEARHAEISLRCFDPQPICDVLAQCDGDIFHTTKIA
jgi:hypothetical protein